MQISIGIVDFRCGRETLRVCESFGLCVLRSGSSNWES